MEASHSALINRLLVQLSPTHMMSFASYLQASCVYNTPFDQIYIFIDMTCRPLDLPAIEMSYMRQCVDGEEVGLIVSSDCRVIFAAVAAELDKAGSCPCHPLWPSPAKFNLKGHVPTRKRT